MSGSLNRVQLIGNLGADPEIRSLQNGDRVCNLRVATTDSWKDSNGDKQERTEWHSVTVWNQGLVDVMDRYLRKGSKVFLEGQLQTRKWQDRDGNDRYSTEIVLRGPGGNMLMLDGASGGSGGGRSGGRDDDRGRGGGRSSGGRSGGSSGSRGTRQNDGWGDDDGWGGNDRSSGGRGDTARGAQQQRGGGSSGGNASGGWEDDLDDDIPF